MSDRLKGWDARRVLYAVLGLQLIMAGLLAGSDVLGALPRLAWPSSAPGFDAPLAPGDQTRRYAPRDTPLPPRAPGAPERPYENSGDMPRRLEFLRTGDTLHVTGEIAPGDDARFAQRLEDEDGLTLAAINSPGGSVRDALAIGRALREAGLNTHIAAGDICFSACPYVLAGGVLRAVGEGAQVGVHQHYFGKNTVLPAFMAVSDIQSGQGDVMEFLDDMGIDLRLMRPALATPPEEIYVLVEEELRAWRVVTEGSAD
ncbi:hypothetical protein [Roseovarius dicentrarchi]|uniref:COG3904 family protein n=1 Tax=Roseovarius dicentrarchi TaxID=2250573 RepID=UPI000DEB07B3|nr:hypothetical protein [Roseovarius dicentrarchi]